MAGRESTEGLDWGFDGVERGNLLRELVEALSGKRIEGAAVTSALAFAGMLEAAGRQDVAAPFLQALAVNAKDEMIRDFAAERLEMEVAAGSEEGATRKSAMEAGRSLEVAVSSIARLRSAVADGSVDAGRCIVVASTSDRTERGFADDGFAGSLLLRYDDVSGPSKAGAFTKADARAFAGFIVGSLAPREGRPPAERLVCACDGGVSRSAALASAVMRFFKGSDSAISNDPRYSPNRLVRTLALEALEEALSDFASPLEARLASLLQDAARGCGIDGEPASPSFRAALEHDLLDLQDVERRTRKLRTGTGLDGIMPAGGFYEGCLYRLSGNAARAFAEAVGRSLARQGCKVLVLGKEAGSERCGAGTVRRVGIHALSRNAPDGRPLIALLLESEKPDAILVGDVDAASDAYYSRFPADVAAEERGSDDAPFPQVLRGFGAAVFAVDAREPPSEDAPAEEKVAYSSRPFRMRAYEDITATWAADAGPEVVHAARGRRAHTRSCVDSSLASAVLDLSCF